MYTHKNLIKKPKIADILTNTLHQLAPLQDAEYKNSFPGLDPIKGFNAFSSGSANSPWSQWFRGPWFYSWPWVQGILGVWNPLFFS